ncbi:hypothetical protein O7599_19640 [Streptomyces sp. WMMC500]|uniref:hypothetical protein n=1 Tax=Streptomyces sp. WMMC500 TaxID=3015154 RepID=UPI00248B6196|nr:hypothetical protein [Streptomyces sp. WMMC500]WBB57891.1 hypothetical protein O7599_19640 [Streptomyces sp. WMMC500]
MAGPAAAVAAGLLAGLPAAVPAAAEQPADAREYRPAKDAEPVEGSPSSTGGEKLAAGKTYSDSIGPGDTLYYSVALDAKSHAWISAVAAPKPGTKVAYGDGLDLELESKDGERCSSSDVDFAADGAVRPIATYVWRMAEPDGSCQDPGVYNLIVTRDSDPTSGPGEWPLELRFMQEPPLAEPAPTTPPDLESIPTQPPPPPTDKAERREGGTGFNDAVGIDHGVWTDRIRPGDTHFYRVPLDWGQQFFLQAEFGTTRVGDDTAYASNGVRVDFYNPARGFLATPSETYYGDDPAAIQLMGPPVAYENRYASFGPDAGNVAFAGWYYVAVSVSEEVGEFADGPVPVELRTTIKGEPEEGPAYDGDAAAAGFAVTDDDRDRAAEGTAADESGDGDGAGKKILAVAGIGAGVLLLAGLGLWTLLARRRTVPGAPGGPQVAGEDTQTAPGAYGGGPAGPYGSQPYGGGHPPHPPQQQNWRQ